MHMIFIEYFMFDLESLTREIIIAPYLLYQNTILIQSFGWTLSSFFLNVIFKFHATVLLM